MELIMSHLKDLKSRDALNRYICAAGWWPKMVCSLADREGENGRNASPTACVMIIITNK